MNKIEAIKKLEDKGLSSNFVDYLDKYLVDKSKFDDAIYRLINGEPIQYIVGNVDFYGLLFNVNKNVLIPRFETEELVDYTIKYINKYFDNDDIDILDIGTGSGCIAITLNKMVNNSRVDAVDISLDALDVAKENNKINNTSINFIKSDVFSNVEKKYDIIISNPPYIAYDEEIMDIVKNNEPHKALYAKNNGLYFYDLILSQVSSYIKEKSIIAFEIGRTQADDIKLLAKKYLNKSEVIVKKDMQGNNRFVFIINIFD